MEKIYDVIIIGAGPAGLSAGLYAGRSRLSTLIIEKSKEGGQIAITDELENYPGCLEDEGGPSLIARMVKQTEHFGCERTYDTITDLELTGDIKVLKGNKGEYKAKTVILAPGASSRPIGCPGEKEFTGKGVSYCATCDAAFFEDMEVYVMGGGDSAVEEAMYLTKYARKVTIVHRRDELRAAKSIQDKAFANPKMAFRWNSVIKELKGDGLLGSIVFEDTKTGVVEEVFAPEDDGTFGVFVFIGFDPKTDFLKGKVNMEKGYILTDDDMHTDIPGVFAAGDCRKKSLRQVVTAAADGAIAAMQANHYIENL